MAGAGDHVGRRRRPATYPLQHALRHPVDWRSGPTPMASSISIGERHYLSATVAEAAVRTVLHCGSLNTPLADGASVYR